MKYRIVPGATLALCLAIVFSIPLTAQTEATGPGAEKAQKVAQVLNLSPQQESQLAPILQAEAPKVKAIQQDPNLTGPEKVEKLKAVHSESDPLVKSILNPTQYKQWEVIRKDELAKIKGGG